MFLKIKILKFSQTVVDISVTLLPICEKSVLFSNLRFDNLFQEKFCQLSNSINIKNTQLLHVFF
jgi:hypothetical protein